MGRKARTPELFRQIEAMGGLKVPLAGSRHPQAVLHYLLAFARFCSIFVLNIPSPCAAGGCDLNTEYGDPTVVRGRTRARGKACVPCWRFLRGAWLAWPNGFLRIANGFRTDFSADFSRSNASNAFLDFAAAEGARGGPPGPKPRTSRPLLRT